MYENLTLLCVQADDVNDYHASLLLKSRLTPEAALSSPSQPDASPAGSSSDSPASFAQQASSSGEGAGPQAVVPVRPPTPERTTPVLSGLADATLANPSAMSPPDSPVAGSGVLSSSQTGPSTPTLPSNRLMLEAQPDMERSPKPECSGAVAAEADAHAAHQAQTAQSSGQAETSTAGSSHVQPDIVAQSSRDGEGAGPQAAGMFGPRTDKSNGAAGSACGSEQLEPQTTAEESPLQPVQKLPVPSPAAPIPAVTSAAAADHQDGSLNGDDMADGWGEAAPPVVFVSTHAPRQPVAGRS